uniref:Uncharacterized protein n=1 Tax=Anopheles dirus TaxID=7168 RepID=A0A182NYD9_9DIPT
MVVAGLHRHHRQLVAVRERRRQGPPVVPVDAIDHVRQLGDGRLDHLLVQDLVPEAQAAVVQVGGDGGATAPATGPARPGAGPADHRVRAAASGRCVVFALCLHKHPTAGPKLVVDFVHRSVRITDKALKTLMGLLVFRFGETVLPGIKHTH